MNLTQTLLTFQQRPSTLAWPNRQRRQQQFLSTDIVQFSGKEDEKDAAKKSYKLDKGERAKSKAAERNGAEYQWRTTALSVRIKIQEILKKPRKLNKADNQWLTPLKDTLGVSSVVVPDPHNAGKTVELPAELSIDSINDDPVKHLENLNYTLTAMLAANRYQPTHKRLDKLVIPVHNKQVADLLKPVYKASDFEKLFDKCQKEGVFNVTIDDKTGLVKTTDISSTEDEIMVQAWFTDTARNLVLQKDLDPQSVPKVLLTTAKAYLQQADAMDAIINDPESYYNDHRGVGVTHIFNPQTLQPYDWLNPKRLESHGLMLSAYCDAIIEGAVERKNTGFKTDVPKEVTTAMGKLAHYLEKLEYWKAPTIGPWEELVYEDGLTGDINIIREAFSKLDDLLYNPVYDWNPDMRRVRRELFTGSGAGLLDNQKRLKEIIQLGEDKVWERLLDNPQEHPDRPADAALGFIGGSNLKLADDVIADVEAHVNVLEFLEKTVVKNNGVIRYPEFPVEFNGKTVNTTDGYLMPNWGLMADKNGQISMFKEAFEKRFDLPLVHLEPSDPAKFHTRALFGTPGKEAEWFMIPEISTSYGNQLKKLLDHVDAENRIPTEKEQALIDLCLKKQTEFVNRSYARITGTGATKANGRSCPAWKVPETYQHVSTFKAEDKDNPTADNRKTVMMPGVNTPLAWAASSLYGASKMLQENLKRLEST